MELKSRSGLYGLKFMLFSRQTYFKYTLKKHFVDKNEKFSLTFY